MFSFSSAGFTLSYQTSALSQGTLLYSFACYMSIFQWVWAVKVLLPLSTHLLQSSTSATNCIPGAARVLSRGSRKWLSWQLCKHVDPPKKAAQESVFSTCPAAFLVRLLGIQSPPPAGCSGSLLLFLFRPCRFAASLVAQLRASWEVALTCPQTWPFLSTDSPATPASKPNTACTYLKTALWLHHPFIHLGHKNNTLFYLWV